MGLKAISQSSFVERMEVGNGHFHLQSAFQKLNTVCPVRLTGLSVETLPGSFATETVGYTFSLHLQDPDTLTGGQDCKRQSQNSQGPGVVNPAGHSANQFYSESEIQSNKRIQFQGCYARNLVYSTYSSD